jgi:polar amino acid transport system permease protein
MGIMGMIAAANMAEIYRGAVASIHHGQWEAATALDLDRWSVFRDIVAPQAFRVALPSAASYLIGLIAVPAGNAALRRCGLLCYCCAG